MYHHSGEEHEDGELREAPRRKPSFTNFEEDVDQDSLDIKPPQAKLAALTSSKRKHREHVHHKRSERHQEGMHRHREKHHRDKPKPEHSHSREKERERYHREQEIHKQEQYKQEQYKQEQYKQEQYRQEEKAAQSEHKHRREERHRRKHEEARHGSSRQEHSDEALQHMRERLLSKRRTEQKHSSRREQEDSALEGEAGLFVKDIINISTKRELTDEEKAEQEMRKEKLLEAEREMARLKEQTQIERERRHHEKALKRKTEEDEDYYTKRSKTEVVTVSSEDDVENDQNEDEKESSYSDDDSRSNSENEEESNISERTVTSKSEDDEEDEEAEEDDEQLEEEDDMKEGEEVNGVKKGDERKEEDDDEEKEILPPYFPALQGCRSVSEFQVLNRIEEGTYGVVYRAKDRRTEETVALKRLKMEREKEGFPITSLREINTLLKGQHPNIVTVREIVVGSMDKIFIVMDYVEHDLKSLMEIMRHKKQNFMPGEVKCLLQQLLLAVAHLHDNWILHRDLKTSNLLLSHKGILKVGDFGLAREYGSPLKAYTPIVVTLWYRAPELLLQTKEYSTPIDIWSVGCIFAEFLLMNALFPGKSEVEQLNKVFKVLGTPNSTVWPAYTDLPVVKKIKFHDFPGSNLRLKFQMLSEQGLSLLTKFLTYDPNQRITAEEALKHGYFREPPLPIDPAMFPTWPAKSELGLKRALAASPKPPSGGRDYKNLGDDGDDGFKIATGFEERRVGAGFSLKFW